MPIAEPAVIQQKCFHPDSSRPVEHGQDPGLIKLKPGGFPIVQQDRSWLCAVSHSISPRPVVKVAADLSFAMIAPGPQHRRSREFVTGSKLILRVERVDPGQCTEPIFHIDLQCKLKAAGPFERTA